MIRAEARLAALHEIGLRILQNRPHQHISDLMATVYGNDICCRSSYNNLNFDEYDLREMIDDIPEKIFFKLLVLDKQSNIKYFIDLIDQVDTIKKNLLNLDMSKYSTQKMDGVSIDWYRALEDEHIKIDWSFLEVQNENG